MRLTRRLERVSMPRPAPSAPELSPEKRRELERLRRMVGELVERSRPVRHTIPAEPDGGPRAHRVITTTYPIDHHHGAICLDRAMHADPQVCARWALDGTLGSVDPSRFLFIDTESTGLAGGTGTIPFLIGMMWFEDEAIVLEQLLLERPGDEGPMLERLSERMAWCSALVSYNGKSYDWPLLRARFVMNRMTVPKVPAHLDLLHASRRVFRRRLGSARLVRIEETVLRFLREGDVPGSEIPRLYWAFVRGEPGATLDPIVEHNRNDVVALGALLALFDRASRGEPLLEAPDRLQLARAFFRSKDFKSADAQARQAIKDAEEPWVVVQALMLTATIAKREKRHDDAERDLLSALEAAVMSERAAIHLALSKLYEHKLKDYDRALRHAEQGMKLGAEPLGQKRIERLKRKAARQSPST